MEKLKGKLTQLIQYNNADYFVNFPITQDMLKCTTCIMEYAGMRGFLVHKHTFIMLMLCLNSLRDIEIIQLEYIYLLNNIREPGFGLDALTVSWYMMHQECASIRMAIRQSFNYATLLQKKLLHYDYQIFRHAYIYDFEIELGAEQIYIFYLRNVNFSCKICTCSRQLVVRLENNRIYFRCNSHNCQHFSLLELLDC